MKMRLKNNSVRLRLTQSEVARLVTDGRVEEAIEFGLNSDQRLTYALETDSAADEIRADFDSNRITISIPARQAKAWAQSEQIGLEAKQNLGAEKHLRLLIEKDFACLAPRPHEDESDAFPHPATTAAGSAAEADGKIC
jgi:hypothetical protein